MRLSDFDYDLPEELIAQHPLHRRDQARLMVVDRKAGTIRHDYFSHIEKYLPPKSVLVLNDSKVIPARLLTKRQTGGEAEIFLLHQVDDWTFEVLMRPTRRLKEGEELFFKDGIIATVVNKDNRLVRFNFPHIIKRLEKIGHIPLPPYIHHEDRAEDRKYYQTVYAKHDGSLAAPTAGLHFTNRLLEQLRTQGHSLERVTLHVGYGTFKPVDVADITQHKMHIEEYFLTPAVWKMITAKKAEGHKIIAVGTTSGRVLESVARCGKLTGSTDIFLYPGCEFKILDGLITNFHLPKSTLLMLVCALAGTDLIRQAYQEAIKEKYRFFSYGDAMVIL
ncbi:MAG: tRNA preQ1(34) S-adenosylmethionine ribosyltransferase-isomerase QueA [Candidatus Omnitrophica bacterium]|nr:tRNA preQ1(34) S-adenosylmethionine ribosyltransferase-isomerase QueA [Candidatus Omnitrophota bacterium]